MKGLLDSESFFSRDSTYYLVLLKVIFIFGLTKKPFRELFLFFWGFLSKSKIRFLEKSLKNFRAQKKQVLGFMPGLVTFHPSEKGPFFSTTSL